MNTRYIRRTGIAITGEPEYTVYKEGPYGLPAGIETVNCLPLRHQVRVWRDRGVKLVAAPTDNLSRAITAVRAFDSVQGEAQEMDAQFDGGEWSGPAHRELLASGLDKVARKFGYRNFEHLYEIACDRLGHKFCYFNLPHPPPVNDISNL